MLRNFKILHVWSHTRDNAFNSLSQELFMQAVDNLFDYLIICSIHLEKCSKKISQFMSRILEPFHFNNVSSNSIDTVGRC